MHYLYVYMNISTAPLRRQNTELLQWILPMKLKDQMSQIHCPQLRLATCFFLFCFISPPPSFTHKLHQSVFVPHNELLWLARPVLTPYIFNLFQKNWHPPTALLMRRFGNECWQNCRCAVTDGKIYQSCKVVCISLPARTSPSHEDKEASEGSMEVIIRYIM